MMVRRAAFPVILLLFVGGLGALLYVSPEWETGGQSIRQLIGLDPAPSTTATQPQQAEAAPNATSRMDTGRSSEPSGPLGTGYANLSVYSEPAGATVLIDGDSIGATPLNRYSIRSGVYIITVERDSFFAADTVAVLRNEQAPTYAVTLNPRPDLPDEEQGAPRDEASATASLPSASTSTESATAEETPATASTPSTESPRSPAEDEAPPPSSAESEPDPEPAPTTGTLRLTSSPSGARVTLDGTVVGTTPLTLESVEAGAHEVAFARSGYESSRMSVTVSAGVERRVEAALTPQMGQLRVLARPWGSIYVDGELRERNADVWYEMPIAAGEHEIAVVHPALGRQTRTVTVAAGEQLSVVIDLRNPSPSTTERDTTPPDTTNRSDRPL